MTIKWEEYTLKVGDTIVGILKGKSNFDDIEQAKQLFYQKNGFKNFKVGQKVLIPVKQE